MEFFTFLAEKRIEEAMQKGDLDQLPGSGQPLALDDDVHVAPELRMAYKVLKNAGYIPEEVAEIKEINSTVELLEHCTDERVRHRQMQKLNLLLTKVQMKRNSPVNLELYNEYYRRAVEKVSLHSEKNSDGDLS
jgi:hypothetical protein